jgi:nucleotide-binding universal stress UspA family protein
MSETTWPVVVGVDGSDTSMAAATWAAAVAAKLEVPLELVNGMPGTGRPVADAVKAIRAAALAEHREHATVILKSAEEKVRAAFPGIEVFTLRSDEPADTLLTSRSRTARLVVLGSDDVSPTAALMVGSTTLAVSTHSVCPVIAWRGTSVAPTDQPIVLGVCGDQTDGAAFNAAFELADRFGVAINAVNGWSAFRTPADAIVSRLIDWDALEAMQWQGMLNTLYPWTELYPKVAVKYFVEPDGASTALMKHAAESQLVVVGTRGRNALAGALLGSTGLNLLHHSPVPVMVCREPT